MTQQVCHIDQFFLLFIIFHKKKNILKVALLYLFDVVILFKTFFTLNLIVYLKKTQNFNFQKPRKNSENLEAISLKPLTTL